VPRLTRAAAQQRTRRALLRTARELFLRDGYFATSLERVADAAGYSKGAVYSNFASKDELCLAVLDRLLAERGRELALAWAAAPDVEARATALGRWFEAVTDDRGWITLEVEFASQLRSNPALRTAFAERAAGLRRTLGALIQASVDPDQASVDPGQASNDPEQGPAPAGSTAEDLAGALVSMGLGLALQRAVDPSVSVAPLVAAVRAALAFTGPGVREPARDLAPA
jgi:AcrR family transcriptional regulator